MLSYGIVTGLERLCLPVLFKEISVDLGLSAVSLGTIWGMDPLAGIFVGLPSGMLADRFGVKRTLTVICILAGVFSALRGFSNNFTGMASTMFLFGLMAAMAPSVTPKITALWFDRKQLGLTNALLNIAWAIGAMTASMTSATILSPLLGGWRNVLFVLGIPGVLVGLLLLTTGREPRKNETMSAPAQVPFREAISRVIRIKEVWIIGLIAFALFGTNMGMAGYLPYYLRNIGWDPAMADGVTTVFSGATTLGVIPMVLLSNRLNAHMSMLFTAMIITVVNMALIPPLSGGSGLWALMVVCTFARSAATPLTNVVILEIEGIGSKYGGTAIGLMSSIGMAGGFLCPPLGNSLEAVHPSAPFFFWAGLSAAALPLFLFLRKRREQRQTEHIE
ncbi:MAG: MFS transporter [Dehalococcoidales bacterium]|nr:MFS transporter [Dehalococcoidales bacterium]